MKDPIYNLPDLFFDGKHSGTNIVFYQNDTSSKNNKVKFSQNLICIMQEGKKEIASQSMQERFDNSNLYILGAGNVLMSETTTSGNKYRSILLFFTNEYLTNLLHRSSLALKKVPQSIGCLKVFKDDFLLNYEKSLDILKDQLINDNNLLNTKIDEILLYLLKTNPQQANSVFNSIAGDPINSSLAHIVQANLNNNLTIQELAFLCNMSSSTFKRRFTQIFNTSPGQYLIEHKMSRAVALLRENKRPTEIYLELGYEDLSAFSNEFKKHFGISPKHYSLNLDQ